MAPTRRKGGSRAAAAVAAASQFKVGDLVLAKVKGFPAWPAKVSVPEEWGFPPDPRKVHVFFFGTQQIAFCSPADVEAFTEEKKEFLLNRRHGKGADFVRAVQEIVDSYEKLKKIDLVNGVNSSEDIAVTNCRNPVESPAIHDLRETMKTLVESPDLQLKASTSADKNESNIRNIDATLVNSVHGEDASTEEPASSVIAKEMPSIATYSSRKRSSGSRAKRCVSSEVEAARCVSKKSSRLESQRPQRRLKTTNSGGSSEDMVSNSSHDGLRRSRRIRKSTITYEGDDTQSLSNGSTEVNGSEIATIDSDSSSLSERSKIGTGCEPEPSDTLDFFGVDSELSKGLNLHTKVIVCKKKRKPNRKRATSSAAEPAVNFDKVEDKDVDLHDVRAPVTSCSKRDMGDTKDDGDEHLPLLKRARVRMGKQFTLEEGVRSSIPIEGKTEETDVNLEQNNSISLSDGSCRAEGCSVLERASDESSKETTELLHNKAQFWQVKNNQSIGCSLDEEATLPPSKRLHRALEAMSANKSEEEQFFAEVPLNLKTKVNESSAMSMPQSPNKPMTGEEGTCLDLKSDSFRIIVSDVGVTETSTSPRQLCSQGKDKSSNWLHRSLEDMSANISEEQLFTEAPLKLEAKVSESSTRSIPQSPMEDMTGVEGTCPNLRSENSPGNDVPQVGLTETNTIPIQINSQENTKSTMELTIDNIDINSRSQKNGMACDRSQDDKSPDNITPQVGVTKTSTSPSPISSLENTKSSMELTGGDQVDNNFESQMNEGPRDRPHSRNDFVYCRNPSEPSSGRLNAEAPTRNSRHLSALFNQASPKNLHPSKDDYETEVNVMGDSVREHVYKEHSLSGESGMSSISVAIAEKARDGTQQSDMTMSCYKAGAKHEEKEFLKSHVDENSHVNSMCGIVEQHKTNERRMATSSLNVLNDHIEVKETKCFHLISSPTGEIDSPMHISPSPATLYHISTSESVADDGKVDLAVTQRPVSFGKSNYVEAQAALSSFEAMLGTLTRTKESIGRATRIAIDFAKYGTAAKVIETLMCHLENEPNLHRRVDLFFLVDSIAQCSRSIKGCIGGAYSSAIQGALPRLLSATAPPGSDSQENRRQCIKVLRLWSERRILPESIVRHHMRELDSTGGLAAVYSRRSLRTERALDDPVRDMGSMLVDEYGSNSSFQLPGLCMPCLLKDEDDGSDSDGGSFEAVTPEHKSEMPEGHDLIPLTEKRGHILEDVDGELEMEDVAPTCSDSAQLEKVPVLENPPEQSMQQHSSHPLPPKVSSSPQLSSMHPPLLPPETVASEQLTDSCPEKNMRGNYRQSVSQTSVSRHNHSLSNSGHYHTPEFNREPQMRIQPPESSNSFDGFHSRPCYNVERGASFQNKAQPPRPPNPTSSQFSRRETPRHFYSNRFHNGHMNRGNYYNNHHERTKPGPYDHRGGWRGPSPSFPGPRYPDRKSAYAHTPYMDHPGEPMGMMNDGWNMPPRPWSHRNSGPYRPHPESSFPVSCRGPGFWRPR